MVIIPQNITTSNLSPRPADSLSPDMASPISPTYSSYSAPSPFSSGSSASYPAQSPVSDTQETAVPFQDPSRRHHPIYVDPTRSKVQDSPTAHMYSSLSSLPPAYDEHGIREVDYYGEDVGGMNMTWSPLVVAAAPSGLHPFSSSHAASVPSSQPRPSLSPAAPIAANTSSPTSSSTTNPQLAPFSSSSSLPLHQNQNGYATVNLDDYRVGMSIEPSNESTSVMISHDGRRLNEEHAASLMNASVLSPMPLSATARASREQLIYPTRSQHISPAPCPPPQTTSHPHPYPYPSANSPSMSMSLPHYHSQDQFFHVHQQRRGHSEHGNIVSIEGHSGVSAIGNASGPVRDRWRSNTTTMPPFMAAPCSTSPLKNEAIVPETPVSSSWKGVCANNATNPAANPTLHQFAQSAVDPEQQTLTEMRQIKQESPTILHAPAPGPSLSYPFSRQALSHQPPLQPQVGLGHPTLPATVTQARSSTSVPPPQTTSSPAAQAHIFDLSVKGAVVPGFRDDGRTEHSPNGYFDMPVMQYPHTDGATSTSTIKVGSPFQGQQLYMTGSPSAHPHSPGYENQHQSIDDPSMDIYVDSSHPSDRRYAYNESLGGASHSMHQGSYGSMDSRAVPPHPHPALPPPHQTLWNTHIVGQPGSVPSPHEVVDGSRNSFGSPIIRSQAGDGAYTLVSSSAPTQTNLAPRRDGAGGGKHAQVQTQVVHVHSRETSGHSQHLQAQAQPHSHALPTPFHHPQPQRLPFARGLDQIEPLAQRQTKHHTDAAEEPYDFEMEEADDVGSGFPPSASRPQRPRVARIGTQAQAQTRPATRPRRHTYDTSAQYSDSSDGVSLSLPSSGSFGIYPQQRHNHGHPTTVSPAALVEKQEDVEMTLEYPASDIAATGSEYSGRSSLSPNASFFIPESLSISPTNTSNPQNAQLPEPGSSLSRSASATSVLSNAKKSSTTTATHQPRGSSGTGSGVGKRRSRASGSIPIPIPVPNLTKKSRGRRVPTVQEYQKEIVGGKKPDEDEEESAMAVEDGQNSVRGARSVSSLYDLDEDGDGEDEEDPYGASERKKNNTSDPEEGIAGGRRKRDSPAESGGCSKMPPGIAAASGKALRTYECTVEGCGKVFARGEHLKRHIRSIHTYEKPHLCPYPGCGKDFSRHDNLGQHMRVHKDYVLPPKN